MANVRYAEVASHEQMQTEISRLITMGFVVANQTPQSVTMIKRKEFSIPMLVIGFFLCLLPLLIYLIVYAAQSDEVVEIRLVDPAQIQNPQGIQLTPDGMQWWDGVQWQSTLTSYPPQAVRSQDGNSWWDGRAWRPIPRN
ncbi:MAG: hypothetical protein FWE35_08215 [Streptosporangiales bacterium]|jgi:hypothetical protein|nr:hypothetical protein [Streptosporangiales bacterium]